MKDSGQGGHHKTTKMSSRKPKSRRTKPARGIFPADTSARDLSPQNDYYSDLLERANHKKLGYGIFIGIPEDFSPEKDTRIITLSPNGRTTIRNSNGRYTT